MVGLLLKRYTEKPEGEVLFTAKRFHVKWTKDEALAAKSSGSIPIVALSVTFESNCCASRWLNVSAGKILARLSIFWILQSRSQQSNYI
jgi:hypothetical protein